MIEIKIFNGNFPLGSYKSEIRPMVGDTLEFNDKLWVVSRVHHNLGTLCYAILPKNQSVLCFQY